jgi:hypothetical protein
VSKAIHTEIHGTPVLANLAYEKQAKIDGDTPHMPEEPHTHAKHVNKAKVKRTLFLHGYFNNEENPIFTFKNEEKPICTWLFFGKLPVFEFYSFLHGYFLVW